jgi:hypothetical protein
MRPLLIISCAMAFAAFLGPWIFRTQVDTAAKVSFLLAICWIILFAGAMLTFRKRGLWLLIGAPFALYWPFALYMLTWACAHDVKACP